MGLECEGYPFRIDMKIFTPETMAKGKRAARTQPAATAVVRRKQSGQLVTALRHEVQEVDEEGEPVPGQIVLHPVRAANPRLQLRLEDPNSRYLNHFLGTVSKLLIVYDLPHNANPYRFVFPKLAASSEPLQEAMNALGALHLAQTTPVESGLRATAIQKYSGTVNSLRQTLSVERPKLAHLATILLLAFYEMMDSGSTAGWRLHLRGARDVFERLFAADTLQPRNDPHFAAAKDFLISCLTYLDMAAAVSTGQPTLIRGNYWDKVGGGWQYNLGNPSVLPESAEDARLEETRDAWSRLMLIQSDIGGLNVALESGDLHESEVRREHVQSELEGWQRNLPELFTELGGPGVDADVVEGASCVLVYAAATFIYYHQVIGTFVTPDDSVVVGLYIAPETAPLLTVSQRLHAATDFILANFERFGRGSNGFGMLWAFFIAGTATVDPVKQSYVSDKLSAMTAYGFGNVSTALELLRTVWGRRRKNLSSGWQADLDVALLEERWWKVQEETGRPVFLP